MSVMNVSKHGFREAFWRLLETDPRSAEMGTAMIGLGVAVSCLFGNWFGGWLPGTAALAWMSVPLGIAGVVFNAVHAWSIVFGPYKARQVCAMVNMVVLSMLGREVMLTYGLDVPGSTAFSVGAIIQLWIIGALESRKKDRRA